MFLVVSRFPDAPWYVTRSSTATIATTPGIFFSSTASRKTWSISLLDVVALPGNNLRNATVKRAAIRIPREK
jgi:hypothetical protein